MKKLKDSDLSHLRRLLGYVRCEIGQSPEEMVATVQGIMPRIEEPGADGKARLVESYRKAQDVPKYVRAAVKALEKLLADEEGEIVEGGIRQRFFGSPHSVTKWLESRRLPSKTAGEAVTVPVLLEGHDFGPHDIYQLLRLEDGRVLEVQSNYKDAAMEGWTMLYSNKTHTIWRRWRDDLRLPPTTTGSES